MLRAKNLWSKDSQWLLPTRFLVYGPSNKLATTEKSIGKKRKGDTIIAGPKKTQIISKEFIESDDEETSLKPKSRTPVKTTAKPKSLQAIKIQAKPKSKLQAQGPPLPQLMPTTQERLEKQAKAIKSGSYKLADVPCKACLKRIDQETLPCAIFSTGEKAACFTWKLGKTHCSFSGKRKKAELNKGEGEEVKIVQKKVKKLKTKKQDVEMAKVPQQAEVGEIVSEKMGKKVSERAMSEGAKDALGDNDIEITKVGLGQEQAKQEDLKMVDLMNVESDVGTPRVDKGKGQATPAITTEPLMLTLPLQPKFSLIHAHETTLADLGSYLGSGPPNGNNQSTCFFSTDEYALVLHM